MLDWVQIVTSDISHQIELQEARRLATRCSMHRLDSLLGMECRGDRNIPRSLALVSIFDECEIAI